MKKPPAAETVSTDVVPPSPRSVFDQIVFARSEFSGWQRGEDVPGDYVVSQQGAITLWPERFNFVSGEDGRCYGYAMPMSQRDTAPRSQKRDGWLVLFVAPENAVGSAVLRPVGWFEEACFAGSYQHRPEPELQEYLYIVSAPAHSVYVIPAEKRASFPVIANDHFTRKWMYARSPFHSGKWRERLAELAEQIVSRKSECVRIG